jgi:cytochrome b6-f complex iron-sulfur subunit
VTNPSENPDRRKFLGTASRAAMAGGLLAGYGTFFGFAGRFLYPAHEARTSWMFVSEIDRIPPGASTSFRTPVGASVVITRQGEGEEASDFLALSSTCPHLGCQVHWEPQNTRFFCPCHNGVFDKSGKGIAGPPGEAGQDLPSYPLRVDSRLLYIQVEVDALRADADVPATRAGHDPCLNPRIAGKDRL